MSMAWDSGENIKKNETAALRMMRLWAWLAVGGGFLLFVVSQLHIKLF